MNTLYKHFFKRLIDFTASLMLLLLLSPFLLFLIIFFTLVNKGKPFFTQERPGKSARIFSLLKFRTMTDERDSTGKLLPDSKRITPIGRFVRSTSMDELPQLINVLKGDMSLVGPRPLLVQYLPLYNAEQARRHEVRPGISGWTQVNGRNSISWKQKFELDIYYVDHLSFWLDVRILWMTFIKVFKREGINSATAATMEAFKGNE
jgi:undecaprenyl phosphate N,N'-diacetylbacillosamine 1-phosphate transferase